VDVWWETLREQDFDLAVAIWPSGAIDRDAGRDARPPFPVGPFYVKDCSMHGFAMFNAPADEQRKCADEINRWLAKARCVRRSSRVMPLSETAAAHRLQEESTLKKTGALAGKIVLEAGR